MFLCSNFNNKDRISKEHDVVYMAKCPDVSCNASYIGQTARLLGLSASEHSGIDDRSHLTRHTLMTITKMYLWGTLAF